MNAADTSPAPRQAPLALWRIAQAFLGVLHALFGAPEDVAARHTLTGKAHAFMAGWLRCAEALMRRLIVLEAAAFAGDTHSFSAALDRSASDEKECVSPRARKLVGFDAEHPEKWRVSFRCFMERRRPRRQVSINSDQPRGRGARAPYFRSAWPLAERYEALIRAFNNPAPYAAHVARRLHATPHRLIEALEAPPEAEHRVDQFALLGEQARAAWFSSA